MKNLYVLGRQPELSVAELEAQLGPGHLRAFGNEAAISDKIIEIDRFGGVIKAAELLKQVKTSSWQTSLLAQAKNIAKHMEPARGKYSIGLSVYGKKVTPKKVSSLALSIKKEMRAQRLSVRAVPNREQELNAAQVIHNKLLSDKGLELIVVINGDDCLLATTTEVQNIDAYTFRDRSKPVRDSEVGMLPPKLAQILINLSGKNEGLLLDPFCGSGTVLIEAALMGFDTAGSDLSARMVAASTENMEWAAKELRFNASISVIEADARSHQWDPNPDLVVGETYLGPPLHQFPSQSEMQKIIDEVDDLHRQFFINIASQLKPGAVISMAVPAWQDKNGKLRKLPVVDDLESLGYNLIRFEHVSGDLVYRRPQQVVARDIVVARRK